MEILGEFYINELLRSIATWLWAGVESLMGEWHKRQENGVIVDKKMKKRPHKCTGVSTSTKTSESDIQSVQYLK
ncbi:MAG TPA: hypothetical protein DCE41_04410 [Cytophagales bacterium]|nr:hypothetical protein [Cytophagales bacterium]HAA22539.1 hypothetical protein [Cytophagales bacterium]HAP64850.1 hypothetical protein [Cytophagales bacterium]